MEESVVSSPSGGGEGLEEGEREDDWPVAGLLLPSLTNEIKGAYCVGRGLQALSELGCSPPLLPKSFA